LQVRRQVLFRCALCYTVPHSLSGARPNQRIRRTDDCLNLSTDRSFFAASTFFFPFDAILSVPVLPKTSFFPPPPPLFLLRFPLSQALSFRVLFALGSPRKRPRLRRFSVNGRRWACPLLGIFFFVLSGHALHRASLLVAVALTAVCAPLPRWLAPYPSRTSPLRTTIPHFPLSRRAALPSPRRLPCHPPADTFSFLAHHLATDPAAPVIFWFPRRGGFGDVSSSFCRSLASSLLAVALPLFVL